MYCDTSNIPDEELANIHAILEAYRTGTLYVDTEKVTVWFGGNMVMGPISRRDLESEDVIVSVEEWRERLGPGMVWVEKVCCSQSVIQDARALYWYKLKHLPSRLDRRLDLLRYIKNATWEWHKLCLNLAAVNAANLVSQSVSR